MNTNDETSPQLQPGIYRARLKGVVVYLDQGDNRTDLSFEIAGSAGEVLVLVVPRPGIPNVSCSVGGDIGHLSHCRISGEFPNVLGFYLRAEYEITVSFSTEKGKLIITTIEVVPEEYCQLPPL